MSDFTLVSSSWVTEAEFQAYVTRQLRFEGWSYTTEQVEAMVGALNLAMEEILGWAHREGYAVTDLATWATRKEWQSRVALGCYLAPEEFLTEDPTDSEWPTNLCQQWEDFTDRNAPLLDDAGAIITPSATTSTAAAKRQVRYTNRNGLLGSSHTRVVDADPSTHQRVNLRGGDAGTTEDPYRS